mgnify:FL=1
MKIENIKINAYGNIENKEINLKDGINIIYGANESGKSTLLNYIMSSFYGISKTKDGKEYTDYDKYKPWNSQEFSGRIKYSLNNQETYEIFRDFNKKNPKIYNEKLEDITDTFEIDKKDGNKFFIEQTGVDKQTYLSTVVSMQQEVRLEEKDQNILIQKIANLAGTGEDNVSYKKAKEKLQNKIRDEIGTNKTTQRPINILQNEIEKIKNRIEEIKPSINKKYEIDNQKQEILEELKELNLEYKILMQLQEKEQNINNLEKEKELQQKNISENNKNIEELTKQKNAQTLEKEKYIERITNLTKEINKKEEQIEQIENKEKELENKHIENINAKKENKRDNIKIVLCVLIAIFMLSAIIGLVGLKNNLVAAISGIIAIILLVTLIQKNTKNKNAKKQLEKQKIEIEKIFTEKVKSLQEEKNKALEQKNEEMQGLEENSKYEKEIENKIAMLTGQIILLQKNNENIQKAGAETNTSIQELKSKNKEVIIEQYQNEIAREKLEKILNQSNVNISNLLEKINNKKINLKGLEIEENTVIPEIEKMATFKENLEEKQEEIQELKKQEEIIMLTMQNLDEAYEEMKTTITPKFTNNLSDTIQEISNKKYSKVTISDINGMVVENARGEYIEAGKLSTGTIDQLYLGLRLSMIDDISKETLPIILDETFAYFDNNRLENALSFLAKTLKNHQAIILTCSNREKEALEKIGIEYNLIKL